MISTLAGELLHYREEGVALSPTILFCERSDEVLKALPGSVSYVIGNGQLRADVVRQVLKNCAPLAHRNWHIFIERVDQSSLRYGIFSYLALPASLPLVEAISVTPGPTALLIKRVSQNTILVQGSHGHSLSLVFSTIREDAPVGEFMERFASDCCAEIAATPERDAFLQYLRRYFELSQGTSNND